MLLILAPGWGDHSDPGLGLDLVDVAPAQGAVGDEGVDAGQKGVGGDHLVDEGARLAATIAGMDVL